jgi:uncharacterized protein YggE
MRTKPLIVSALLLAALVLGACGPTVSANANAPAVRTLSVSGTGQTFLSPDIAYIYVGVHTEQDTAADAVAANNTQTQKVIDALKAAGVDPKDIRTSNFSIWPNQQYGPDGQPTSLRYVVDNSVYVTVRDLNGLGDLLDSAIAAGANSINSVQFDVADAAGMTLGEVQSISFAESAPVPFTQFGKGGGGDAAAASTVPINPGQLTVTATVNMSYAIK